MSNEFSETCNETGTPLKGGRRLDGDPLVASRALRLSDNQSVIANILSGDIEIPGGSLKTDLLL